MSNGENEVVVKKWKFEIFHSEFVDGIRQTEFVDGIPQTIFHFEDFKITYA